MVDDSIAWTSFRTLEPNPNPYTPMTQSMLERGVETSSLAAAVRRKTPLTTFHCGYLYFNVVELRRLLEYFLDLPEDVLVQYFRDDTSVEFDRISIAPSLAGLALLVKVGSQSSRIILHGLTVERRLPDRPSVESLSNSKLLSLLDTHQEFLTDMIGAHVLFSGLAEAYAAGIERFVPGGPSRQRTQELVSTWTNSKTSEMACWAASLKTDKQREAFLDVFGHRCPREMEIAVPRWRDDPSTLQSGAPRSLSLSDDTESADKTPGTLARFALYPGSLLERLRENPKNEWLKSYAYLRDLLLEVGRRATRSGHLLAPKDVFYVSFETARQFLDEPLSRTYTHRAVSRGKSMEERNRTYSPSLLVDENFRPIEEQERTDDNGTLGGLGVSDGQVSGRAVTAQSPEGVDLSDDSVPRILVTEFTDAGWTPLFFQVDGLIMERGSLLSHGSIVAREAGIPAVVNVKGAMERIETGDWIEVNAEEGSIGLIDR